MATQYQGEGYEVSALHYLLKPVSTEKLFRVLDRLPDSLRAERRFLFRTGDSAVSFPESKIWYVEACAHQCTLYTEKERYELKQSITAVEQYLTQGGACRCVYAVPPLVHRESAAYFRHCKKRADIG
ncbi:MAG: hypothetical protein NC337_02615 [Roseburia sp.]|nr:hypothetical protein [Roseburia sp.]